MMSRIPLASSLIFTLVMSLGFVGCTSKNDGPTDSKVLNVATWTNFISPEVREQFTKQTGIQLNVSYYASNEELLAKVQAGAGGIDVAFPSDYMVNIMTQLKLLRELDMSKIPNKAGINPDFMAQEFDPQNKYSLPYSWSTCGIAVHRDLYKGEIKSWKDVFENKELAGKLSLLDDVREVTAAALKYHGYSVNSVDPEQLKKAAATLKELRPRVKMFRSDMKDGLLNKEVAVAHVYSSDGLQAVSASNGKIEYILPTEGGTRAIDNMVILSNAQNIEAAHALINFLLTTDANVPFVKVVMGGPVLKETASKLPPELKNSKQLFPSSDVLSKFEGLKDLGEHTAAYDRLWTELKSQ